MLCGRLPIPTGRPWIRSPIQPKPRPGRSSLAPARRSTQVSATKLEYENDVIALDANLVEPTAANPAGWFASYHAYPYYPDFMLLDPGLP